jgi:xylulokinase
MSYMGVDIGQTGCRAIIFDGDGTALGQSYREYPTVVPEPGWAELDSDLVRDRCFEVMREAQAACPEDRVRGLAVTCQGEAFTPVGPGGESLSNAMITFDTRAADVMERWSEKLGIGELYRLTGHTAHPMFSIFKLLWIMENRRDIFRNAVKFLCFEDFLQYHLGIDPHISWSLAGRTMLFNIHSHEWDGQILESIGVGPERFAEPSPSGRIVGTVKPSICKALGLGSEVHVVSGGHDQPMGALGSGVVTPGKSMYATGTSECITPAFTDPIQSHDLFTNNICTYDYILEGMYTTVAFSLTGGNILKWFRDQWGQEEIREAERTGRDPYELLLQGIGTTPTSLLVLPYFTPTGTPYFDHDVYGAVLGLKLHTTRADILRALLEGVALEMRLNLEILDRSGIHIDELRAIGGGARSPIWTQLKADVLNKPITTVRVTEAACFAAAMLACSAITGEPLASLVDRWVQTEGVIEPIPENAEIYSERFETYRGLYPALKKLPIHPGGALPKGASPKGESAGSSKPAQEEET